jgi:CDP-paratose 2-epimerase
MKSPNNTTAVNNGRKGRKEQQRPVLVTGGAGFIGTNLAHRLLSHGQPVLILDNLSRLGVKTNLEWLRKTHGNLVRVEQGDVRDTVALAEAAKDACFVFHLAAQVAVTTSLEAPVDDFEVNGRGTLNLLEALRGLAAPPPVVYTSTNKVYGDLADVALVQKHLHYEPVDPLIREFGISEARPLEFHSPYGCSKGVAEQYILDYARTYGLKTMVFRMSCIYGSHQFGNEDQGWVAHFLIRALEDKPITVYGDGKQVRDILFIDDLVDAFLLAQENIERLSGQAINIGGGPQNVISLLELFALTGELHGKTPPVAFDQWRAADQRYYVSDTRKFQNATGWAPCVGAYEGVRRLYQWLSSERRARSFVPSNLVHKITPGATILTTGDS